MKIYKKDENIIFEIPFWSKRFNPYMPEDSDAGEHQTLIGIITTDHFGNEELGFAQVIDMDYKGKEDQHSEIMIHYWKEDKEEFIKLCEELKIDCFEYPICAYCRKAIYGSFTFGNKGNQCFDCRDKITED